MNRFANVIPGPPTNGLGRRRRHMPMHGLGITFDGSDVAVVQTTPPQDYAVSLETIAPNVTSLVDDNTQPGETWYEALARLLPALAATEQQRQLLQVQTERAKAGLPPLDTSQYGLGVKVGLSEDSKQLLIYGGVALLALIGLGILKFGRR